jgi:hypothetical protein
MSIWKRLGIEFGGTEGHVLTIEGGKGKFKAPSGGGGNTTAVDWIPASDFAQSNGTAMVLTYTGTYPARYRAWPMVTAPAATPQAVQATWKVPLNYVSGGTISVLLYANTANDSAITMRAHYLPITVTPELTLAGQDLITAAHTVLSKNSAPLGLAILPVGRLLNAVNSVGSGGRSGEPAHRPRDGKRQRSLHRNGEPPRSVHHLHPQFLGGPDAVRTELWR